MTTLDDKLLGEKLHYYCSSSSEDENESDDEKEAIKTHITDDKPIETAEWNGLSRNTGPKGVIEDWQQYQELARKQREANDKESIELCKKLSLVCRPESEDLEEDSESFLLEYRKKRMQEMLSQYSNKNYNFGAVVDIKCPQDFLQTVDEEDKNTTIIIHVYDNNHSACKKMNEIFVILADQYKDVKFCKTLVTAAGLSLSFKISGIPALLVYKNKQIIGNFVRVTDEFGDDFCEGDVENFLIEHSILGNKVFPTIMN